MIERTGITRYENKAKRVVDTFGELTMFRKISSAMVRQVVSEGKWFAFGKKADENQVDIFNIANDSGVKFGNMLEDGWFDTNAYRTRLYKYMLHDFLCYVEVPIVKRSEDLNGAKNSYNKMLITSNIEVVALYLGISTEEAESKYGSRLLYNEVDSGDPDYPYLKLYTTKEGERKITKPRSDLNLEQVGIRVIPLYALAEGVNLLYDILKKDTYDITFLKDSGQVRTLNTTFSNEKIKEVYGDGDSILRSLQTVYDGDFLCNPTLERGYIRVFEMGSSIYNNPTRSINFARITKFEKAEPDLSYMYIDMDGVIDFFKDCLFNKDWTDEEIAEIVEAMDEFDVGSKREVKGVRVKTARQLEIWAEEQELLLSTVFIRQLALFMIAYPATFNGYTGTPQVLENASTGGSTGEGLLPTDLDLDMPFV